MFHGRDAHATRGFARTSDDSYIHARLYYNNVQSVDEAADITVAEGETISGIDASLAIASHITGKVTARDGTTPITNGCVTAYRLSAGGDWNWWHSTYTDAAGEYDIGRLAAGTYRIGFVDDTYVHAAQYYNNVPSIEEAADITVATGETITGINASLAAASHITGRVTSSNGMTPITNVCVTAYRLTEEGGWDWVNSAHTDATGAYDIGGLSAGTCRIGFNDSGHISEYYNDVPSVTGAMDIQLTEGATVSGIDASLAIASHITGRVTGPDGITPLERIWVTAYQYVEDVGWAYWCVVGSDFTDTNGEYDVGGLPAGTYLVGFANGGFVELANYVGEYYDNVPSIEEAADITVAAGETISGIDASLAVLPTHTSTTPVSVPFAWLDGYPSLMAAAGGDYEAAASMANGKRDGAGNAMAVWQDYVAGTCPTNPGALFRCLIEMRQGTPVLKWEPDLGNERVYTIWGRSSLLVGEWGTPTNASSRFFRVEVSLP